MTGDFKSLLRSNLLAFAMKAYKEMNAQSMPDDPYLQLLADRLAGVVTGKTKRLIVNLPPRHFKTWIGSVSLSAWVLGRDPSAKILIVTYGAELAEKIAHGIRTIMRSEWYRQLFKKARLTKSRSRLDDFVTTAGGGVRSVSIEGGVTGHGADYIIVDDPIELKDCENIKRLSRVVELFDGEILTRLNNPKLGRIVIIAHRVNEEDLSGHLLQQEGGWKHLMLPLIAPRTRSYKLGDGRVWERAKGELLRPHAFSQSDIELLQAARRPGFETVQQQNPGGTRLLRIKSENFGTFPSALVPMSDSGVVLSVDPGQKGGPLHSFSVVQAWLPVRGNHLLLEQWREQAHYPVLREAVRRMIKRHNVSAVLIEDTNQGPSLVSEIRPRPGMRVCPIIPIGDKIERVRKQQAIIRSGGIKLPLDAVWRESFVAEWTLFPCAGYDDQVDATAQYLDWISNNPAPPKRERFWGHRHVQFARTTNTTDGVYSGRAGQGRRVGTQQWQALVLVAANCPLQGPGRIRPGPWLLGSAARSRCADVELCGRGDVCRVLRRAGARPLRELYRNRLRHDQATYLQNEITRSGNVIREKGIKGE